MENLSIYNQLRVVPAEAKKRINGGRLDGKTDINPQYRIMAMTAVFGPCGIGWYYTIDKQWTEEHQSEVKCFCNISLYIKDGDRWSAPIPGTGGSTIVEKNRSGFYVNDEGYKMALTDALSVAMKALGVAADVYFEKGVRYGTKYEQPTQQQAPAQPAAPAPAPADISAVKPLIEAATNRDELRKIIADNQALKNAPEFQAAVNKRWQEVAA